MEIGVFSACLSEVSLPELIRWAGESGFKALELSCTERGPSWFSGAHLVPSKLDDQAAAQLEEELASAGLRLSALTYYANMLEPDDAARNTKWRVLGETMRAAVRLRVPVVCCYVGRNTAQRTGECLANWARLAADIIKVADEHEIRLAIDNDPLPGWLFEDMPGNVAFSPEIWEKIFTHVRSEAVGLNLNPGPLHWLGVDYLEAATDYAERIYHVHLTDVEVFPHRRSDCSVLRPLGGWWRYRLPGLGDLDLARLLRQLQENGYDSTVAVAGIDPVWTGSQDRIKRGLEFSRRHLGQLVV